MGKKYFTADQKEWLHARTSRFTDAQARGRLQRFLSEVVEEWAPLWPLDSVPPEDSQTANPPAVAGLAVNALKSKILSWYHRNAVPKGRSTKLAQEQIFGSVKTLQHTRAPQAVEVYQKLYPQKIKDALQEHSVLASTDPSPNGRLALVRKVASSLLKDESTEVKTEIADEVARCKMEREAKLKAEEDDASAGCAAGGRSPSDYQAAINILPDLLNKGLQPLAESTGWAFLVLAAGPFPNAGGDIRLYDIYVGPKTELGNTFPDAYSGYIEGYRQPFSAFVQSRFPEELRQRRALSAPTIFAQTPPPPSAPLLDTRALISFDGPSRVSSPLASRLPSPVINGPPLDPPVSADKVNDTDNDGGSDMDLDPVIDQGENADKDEGESTGMEGIQVVRTSESSQARKTLAMDDPQPHPTAETISSRPAYNQTIDPRLTQPSPTAADGQFPYAPGGPTSPMQNAVARMTEWSEHNPTKVGTLGAASWSSPPPDSEHPSNFDYQLPIPSFPAPLQPTNDTPGPVVNPQPGLIQPPGPTQPPAPTQPLEPTQPWTAESAAAKRAKATAKRLETLAKKKAEKAAAGPRSVSDPIQRRSGRRAASATADATNTITTNTITTNTITTNSVAHTTNRSRRAPHA